MSFRNKNKFIKRKPVLPEFTEDMKLVQESIRNGTYIPGEWEKNIKPLDKIEENEKLHSTEFGVQKSLDVQIEISQTKIKQYLNKAEQIFKQRLQDMVTDAENKKKDSLSHLILPSASATPTEPQGRRRNDSEYLENMRLKVQHLMFKLNLNERGKIMGEMNNWLTDGRSKLWRSRTERRLLKEKERNEKNEGIKRKKQLHFMLQPTNLNLEGKMSEESSNQPKNSVMDQDVVDLLNGFSFSPHSVSTPTPTPRNTPHFSQEDYHPLSPPPSVISQEFETRFEEIGGLGKSSSSPLLASLGDHFIFDGDDDNFFVTLSAHTDNKNKSRNNKNPGSANSNINSTTTGTPILTPTPVVPNGENTLVSSPSLSLTIPLSSSPSSISAITLDSSTSSLVSISAPVDPNSNDVSIIPNKMDRYVSHFSNTLGTLQGDWRVLQRQLMLVSRLSNRREKREKERARKRTEKERLMKG